MQVVGAIAEHVIPVEDDGEDGRDWLNQHELEHALLHTTVENLVSLERSELVEWPWLLDPSFEFQVDYESVLTA